MVNKACNDKYKELKIISKSFNRNPNDLILRTKFYQLRNYIRAYVKN